MSENGMQWVVLEAARANNIEWRGHGDRPDEWRAYKKFAPFLRCYALGHPARPRPKRKYHDRPWRCASCETWWVTVEIGPDQGFDYRWEWQMVSAPEAPTREDQDQ